MDADAVNRAQLLAEVNASIRQLASASASAPTEWEFMCECGGTECRANVLLTVDAYSALHDGGFPVLAPGHRESEVARAERLRSEAQALRAQADHQIRRARRNVSGDEPRQ